MVHVHTYTRVVDLPDAEPANGCSVCVLAKRNTSRRERDSRLVVHRYKKLTSLRSTWLESICRHIPCDTLRFRHVSRPTSDVSSRSKVGNVFLDCALSSTRTVNWASI